MPLHTLLVVRSYGYEFTVETVPLKVECVDTYRIRPKVSFCTRILILPNSFKCNFVFVNNQLIKSLSFFFFLFSLQNCSPDRKESDVLETVPAHFDAPLPQII